MQAVICQFCSRSTPLTAIPNNWHQADFDLWICPSCIPPVMTPTPEDPSYDYEEEDTALADNYAKHFYNDDIVDHKPHK